jgi:acetate kinase
MPDRILVINSGSSSVKYQVFDVVDDHCVSVRDGKVERIGESASNASEHTPDGPFVEAFPIPTHAEALEYIIHKRLGAGQAGGPLDGLVAVGHRVVHGGEAIHESSLVTPELIKIIETHSELAPLHNPPNLEGIRVAQRLLPGVAHVAVFDTAFHRSIPPSAYMYAVPYEYYTELSIRRYGFHGTSYRYVVGRITELDRLDEPRGKMIIFHLGNGCSCAAVRDGQCMDTSMGFTPVEGLVMGTRSGDVDPAMLRYLAEKKKLKIADIDRILNKKSGLLGVSGVSNDLRELTEAADGGNERARLAIDVFVHRIRKYIGAYAAVLEGLDTLVFTAGIGENAWPVRQQICKGFEFMSLELDPTLNRDTTGRDGVISSDRSRVRVMTIHTDEEAMIAVDAYDVYRRESVEARPTVGAL